MTRAQPSPEWMTRAACLGVDPETFFPVDSSDADEARAICALCPVRAECLAYAVELDVEGVWGGLTRRQRGKRYVCRGCGASVGSYRHRYCEPCGKAIRAAKNADTARQRRASS